MRTLLLAILVLPCGAADQTPDLAHIREVNLERTAKLPNFVADEMVTRYKSHKADPPKWELMDVITSEIAVQGKGGFARQHVLLNGQAWNKPFPVWNWGVAFGDELTSLFDPKCPTVIEFEGRQESPGKPVLAYRFHSPPNGCFGTWTKNTLLFGTKRYNPERHGRFQIDVSGSALIQFDEEATGFPKSFGSDTWKESTTWDHVRIGEESFVLPVSYDIVLGSTSDNLFHAVVEYRNHRHFEASANIKFEQ